MSSLVFREARPDGEPVGTMLCVHGFPESSYMWNHVLEAAAGAGWRALAPDLPGFGDTPADPPGTWERHVEALDRFVEEHELGPIVLAVHDWGGLIGLRWALERGRDVVSALVIADTGFFPDGKWHGLADVLRTEGQGEELVHGIDEEGFKGMLRAVSTGMDDRALREYWKGYDGEVRRQGQLELYRSGDFEKIEGLRLADLDVPTLVLWGADDPFAPVAGAHRFGQELPRAEVVVLDGVGHFIFDDAPDEAAGRVADFLRAL